MGRSESEVLLHRLACKYLSSHLLDAALFYAERLHSEVPSADSLHLLALCYFRLGKTKQSYLILHDNVHSASPANKYLFALACCKLDKLEEGEQVLRPLKPRPGPLTLEQVRNTPGGAEGVFLLGRICRRQHRKDAATACFKLSLAMDPYLWSAVAELGEMGEAVDMDKLFGNFHAGNSSDVVVDPLLPMRTDRYYSAGTVRGSAERLQQYSVAEQLSGGGGMGGGMVGVAGGVGGVGGGDTSGRVSMSLGLSSMSLHVPFASPSPSVSPQMRSRSWGAHSTVQDSVSGSSDIHMSMNMTESRYERARSDSYSRYANDEEVSGHGNPRTLFDISTPGLTPIVNNTTIGVGMSGMSGMGGMSAMGMGGMSMSGLGGVGGVTPAGSGINMCMDTDTGGSGMDMGVGEMSESQDQSQGQGRELFGSVSYGDNTGPGLGPSNGPARRVSFGPMARLSFSGALPADAPLSAVGAQAQAQALAQEQAGSYSHSGGIAAEEGDSWGKGAVAGGVAGDRGGSPTRHDDYPFKLPRMDREAADTGTSSSHAHRNSPDSTRHLARKLGPSDTPLLEEPFPSSFPSSFPTSSPQRRRYGSRGISGSLLETGPLEDGDMPPPLPPPNGVGRSRAGGGAGCVLGSAVAYVDRLVTTFARAYQLLCMYCCHQSMEVLQTLPAAHFASALANQWIGKAYYEMNAYKPAILAYREMLKAEPYRLQGMETLSTALWHLRRDKELSALAQRVVEVDRLAPETWCVVGNCFSLQKEPDTAIRFFHRALQVDPSFTYAHTLSGHEQVNNEDLDKAVESFRLALLSNDRHYNAWYGLGSIYHRQERYELAEYHFRRALGINPASSVLHCYLGMALHAQNSASKTAEALEVLTAACARDTHNPQLHFQRAHILVACEEFEAALEALLVVEQFAPKEPPVHALLGQVYHQMGQVQLAIKHLNIAMDLDPKEAVSLKGILEQIDEPAGL